MSWRFPRPPRTRCPTALLRRGGRGAAAGRRGPGAVPAPAAAPRPNSARGGGAGGCGVVASAQGGLPEIVREGERGVLVRPGDVGALAGALAALRDDPERRERLGAAARVDVRERF